MTHTVHLRERPRIAMITPRYAPEIGGVEQNAEHVARGASSAGVDIDVLTTDATGGLAACERRDGVNVRRFSTALGDSVYFVSPGLGRWLYRHAGQYDLFHVHSYHSALLLEVVLVSRMTRTPFVVSPHYHGTGHTTVRRGIHVFYRPLGRALLRGAAMIICNTPAEAALVRRDVGSDRRITVVPPGIDVDEILDATPIERRPDRVILLSVGRLEPYKQTIRLLDVLSGLPDHYEAVVIGVGPSSTALREAAATRGVDRRVGFLGSVPRATLLGWYRSADVLVSLSRHEAFGLVLAEAAAAGASIVASDIPAHRDVARYLAPGQIRLVAPDAADIDLESAIIDVAGRGRREPAVASIPTWDDTVAGMVGVYRSVLEARATAGHEAMLER